MSIIQVHSMVKKKEKLIENEIRMISASVGKGTQSDLNRIHRGWAPKKKVRRKFSCEQADIDFFISGNYGQTTHVI